jgi:polyphosphate kinase
VSGLLDHRRHGLSFCRRLLVDAADRRQPLLERAAQFASYGRERDRWYASSEPTATDAKLHDELHRDESRAWHELRRDLGEAGIALLESGDWTAEDADFARSWFEGHAFPLLTPLAVDAAHPLARTSHSGIWLAVRFADEAPTSALTCVPLPALLPAWIEGTTPGRFFRLLDAIEAQLPVLLADRQIAAATSFRLLRSESDHAPRSAESRSHLLLPADCDAGLDAALREHFRPTSLQIVETAAELDFTGLATIAALDLPDLKFPLPRSSLSFPFCDPQEDLFEELRAEDQLVHAPYEDFARANAEFVARAVRDPQVVTIKLLVEGLADELPIIPDLARAAEMGKQIVCLVRPDIGRLEAPSWRKRLERAGAYVLEQQFPFGRTATCVLVVRREANEMRCYASLGDHHDSRGSSFGLLTARTACTRELVALFHALTSSSQPGGFSQLFVAPFGMREPLRKLIRREAAHALAGEPAGITLQLTALEDPALCDELALAATAGVPIDVIVSATCLLAPTEKKPGRIRVFSPAGWADERSRLLYFRNRAADPVDGDFYLASGDWTETGLDHALELAIPLEHRRVRERCWQSLELLRVDPDGWFLDRTGEWLQKNPESSGPIGARQRRLWRLAIDRLQRARNEEADELQPIAPRIRPPWMLKAKRSRLADALRHMPKPPEA